MAHHLRVTVLWRDWEWKHGHERWRSRPRSLLALGPRSARNVFCAGRCSTSSRIPGVHFLLSSNPGDWVTYRHPKDRPSLVRIGRTALAGRNRHSEVQVGNVSRKQARDGEDVTVKTGAIDGMSTFTYRVVCYDAKVTSATAGSVSFRC
jgi:hypothetical protein